MKRKFGRGTVEVYRVHSGRGDYDQAGRYYGSGLPVYSVTYEDDERDAYTGERGRWIDVEVRARSIAEAIEAAGDEITRRLRMPRGEWRASKSLRETPRARAFTGRAGELQRDVEKLLERHGFSRQYAGLAAMDIVSDFINGTMDEPIWHHPTYNHD